MNIVCLGGGHGLARTLEALVLLGYQPTAIVTVADNGGSTGRLRVDRDIPAIGDLRHATQALAKDPADAAWLGHRFDLGDLAGHAQGNLAILAQMETGKSLVEALDRIGHMVNAQGRVLPCTTESVHLRALDHGQLLIGQVAVQNRNQLGPLERLWLEPDEPAGCEEALKAIAKADMITLGPGSLLTSLAPVLLVPSIAQAVAEHQGRCLLVANTTTQPGETDGLGLEAQFSILMDLIPGNKPVDIVVHEGMWPGGPGVPLGTVLHHERLGQMLIRDVAVRPYEGVGTGHDHQRLADALRDYIAGEWDHEDGGVSA